MALRSKNRPKERSLATTTRSVTNNGIEIITVSPETERLVIRQGGEKKMEIVLT